MSNRDYWKATKAKYRAGRWRASREVGVGSRIVADLVILTYARELKTHAAGILVDLGCGKAPYFGIYRDLVSKCIWVDWGSSIHQNEQVDVYCDLGEGINLPDSSADTILCTDVLEHIFQPHKTWAEIGRVLRCGGKAIIGVPFLYWIHEQPFDFHRYTSYALRRYAEEAGLDVMSIEAIGGVRHVLADLLCKTAPGPLKLPIFLACSAVLRLLAGMTTPMDTPFPLHYVMVVKKPC